MRIGGLLLTDNYTRQQMDDLLSCIDAYVSLHRAEAFGAGMAIQIEQLGAALAKMQETSAGLGAHLNMINLAVVGLQQQQAGLHDNISDMSNTLANLQRSHTELGTHILQVNDALSDLQRVQSEVIDIVNRLQHLPDQVAVQEENIRRLSAQLTYMSDSINELISGLHREIGQIAAGDRTLGGKVSG